jgi:hypothetical protein
MRLRTRTRAPFEIATRLARRGAIDRAFGMLAKSVDLGWRNAARLGQARDLASLAADPRWETLVQRARQR